MCPRLGRSDGGVRAVSCSLKKVEAVAARDGSKSPPESSGLAFDNAAVAFTASGQSIIDKRGASNDATTATLESGGGIAALGDELCATLDGELYPEPCATLDANLCAALDCQPCPELCAELGDEPCPELCAAFSAGFAFVLTRTFAIA